LNNTPEIKTYPPLEEKINIFSHALGLVLSIIGLVALVMRASKSGDVGYVAGAAIFGLAMICLYAASTWYHSATDPTARARRRVFDHASIYVLIAGTYTPYALISLSGGVGTTILLVAWGLALTGIVLKLFFTGRFSKLSTLMYVAMGWIIVFAVQPFVDGVSSEGMFWLVAGGVAYTVGAVIYSIRGIPFNHAIFHICVLLGSLCHFISIYFYVLPDS